MNNYIYIQSEPSLWTVGFYEPSGKWHPESDHNSPEAAAERVHWLNGGNKADQSLTRSRQPVTLLVGEL